MKRTVRELLGRKGRQIWSVEPDSTVFEALKMLAERNVGALLVMRDGRLLGIMSERDYARKVVLADRWSRDTKVREIMTERVVYVHPEQTVEECMALMTDKRIRHLPVLDGGEVVGVLSIGDLVKAMLDEKQFLIDQLESYITGSL